ncbi:MAG: aldose epimerase family protein [Clostridia bacterium]|nr:aldose epimerase family protein [Clostridia bacterium]
MSIEKKKFGISADGQDVYEYILTNLSGASLHVLDYGLRIHKLFMPDRDGNLGDVVLGYDNIEGYYGNDYQGACIGRYANRIGNAEFTLDGVTYKLDKNDGENSLHGGTTGYHQLIWDLVSQNDGDEPSVTFAHTSPDMDENYPGKLEIRVTYSLSAENELKIRYEAESDKKTVYNPTNHAFFNLTGKHDSKVLDTELTINASCFTPVDDELIPTGMVLPVYECLDFTKGKKLGKDMFAEDHTIELNGGFDHNFCVDGEGFRLHAEAYEPESGRVMQVYSDMPGIQLYTFNKAPDVMGKYGCKMTDHGAFCLETQFYPDSPNNPYFPFTYVVPGEKFVSETVYKFSVK